MRMSLNDAVDTLKAAAESSRLRILVLLSRGDLTVSDMTEILNQSQPRVSRHLRLLLEARLIERYQEGSWAFFRLSDQESTREFIQGLVERIEPSDAQLRRDAERLDEVKRRRQDKASDYFSANAATWDHLRSLHAPDKAVEAALIEVVGDKSFQSMLDLGTGTGRILEILSSRYNRGVGIDLSREMLAVARANLDRAGVTNAQVRLGDLFAAQLDRNAFDLVTMHQVLHYLDDPGKAVQEAAKLLRPSGRLIVVDFAPHELEFLRDKHAHQRLGFSDQQIGEWFDAADLALEESRAFAPAADEQGRLTVKLWVGRDQRLLIADPSQSEEHKEFA